MIRSRRVVPWLLAAFFYAALTIVHTWPLVLHLPTTIASDLGDPLLNAWILWWNARAVPFTARWWNAPMFWPAPGALAFSEVLLGLSPITSPMQWLGASPVTAYNVAFLLTFFLSALAAHALVFSLTGRHDAAAIAGLVYGFHPFRTAHFPHIQVMASYGMPAALLALHQYVTNRNARWLWLFGAAWLMQALSNGYFLFFFPVLIGLWLAWFGTSSRATRSLGRVLLAWVIASLPLVLLLWTYRQIHGFYGFQRDFGETQSFGADLTALADASPLLKFWHLHAFHQGEGELFPGLTAPLIILLLAIWWLWHGSHDVRGRRTCLRLLLASVTFVALALTPLLIAPWSIAIGKITFLSVRSASRPLWIAVLLLAAALAFEPRVADAWRRRSPLLFYVLATMVMYLLCFGPRPRFLGAPFLSGGPYRWLMALPGYDAVLRVPARFAMLAALCLAAAAALAFARLTSRARQAVRATLAAAAVAGVLIDSWISYMPLPPVPPRSHALESLPAGAAVLEIPYGVGDDDLPAMYRGMYHGHPVVNGYSGFFPPHYDVIRRGLAIVDPQIVAALAAWGPVAVAVNDDARWVKALAAYPGAVDRGSEDGRRVFTWPGGAAPPEVNSQPLRIQSAWASVHNDRIALALDGDPQTRWESGPQRGIEVVTIDLGSRRNVDGLIMTVGEHTSDFPRVLAIDSSEDGRMWSTRWEGSTVAVALAGALRHPAEVPLTFALPHVAARMLRLRQLGQDPVFYWTIVDLKVYGR